VADWKSDAAEERERGREGERERGRVMQRASMAMDVTFSAH